jgi:hypothetical protein
MTLPVSVRNRQVSSHSSIGHSKLTTRILPLSLLLFGAQFCSAAVRVEAYRGEPFGIGRITIDLAPGSSTAPANDDRCTVVEEQNRVLYAVIENKSSRRLLRGR